MAEKKEKLTLKEKGVLGRLSSRYFGTGVWQRKTKVSVAIGMIGLPGSGKSFVAKKIAQGVGGTVISADEIRIELRKATLPYDHVRLIAEELALETLRGGGNPILDSDFIEADKRAMLLRKARKEGAKVCFVRTVCDFHIMSQRIRGNPPDEFYQGAKTKSTAEDHGVDVKLGEWSRRTPLHYKQVQKYGNSWELRDLKFDHFLVNTDNKDKVFLGLSRIFAEIT